MVCICLWCISVSGTFNCIVCDGYRVPLVREEQQDLLAPLACLDVLVLRDPQDLLERRVHR